MAASASCTGHLLQGSSWLALHGVPCQGHWGHLALSSTLWHLDSTVWAKIENGWNVPETKPLIPLSSGPQTTSSGSESCPSPGHNTLHGLAIECPLDLS